MKRKKLMAIIAVPIVIVLLVIVNVTRSPSAIEVEVSVVSTGEIKQTVSAPGRIKPFVEVKLSSDIMGRIIDLRVEEGELVEAGQIVALIDSRDQEARVRKAESALLSAEASFQLKESTYRISKELFSKELVSREEFHAIETEREIAETAVAQARATLAEARQELLKTKILTPISGTVTALNVEEGEMAVVGTMNNPGTVLMSISNLARVVAVCEVDESDVIDIELGHAADVSIDALPDTSFEGKVIEVSSSGTTYRMGSPEEVTNFEVKIELGEPVRGLKPNMSATCEIVTEHKTDVLKVPIQSVIQKKEKDGVFVVEEGRAAWKDVKSGISDEQWVEMKDGVAEGDSVVSGTYKVLSTLKEGDLVKASSSPEKKEEEKEAEEGESVGEEGTASEGSEGDLESSEEEPSGEETADEGDAGESH